MSEATAGVAATADDRAFLATVPLLEGLPEPQIAELAAVVRRLEVAPGETLWRQGDESAGMLVVVDGRVAISLRLPGDRAVEVASMGPGEVLGEIPLLDGGRHSANAMATEPTTLLALGRADFAALVSRRHPTASALKRRIAGIVCARLRRQSAALAASLARDAAGAATTSLAPAAELEPCGPPDGAYVRRLASYHAIDPVALRALLSAGRFARCLPGRTLIAEGAPSTACFLTINGAVEQAIVRGARRIRVGLAGPGHAFGYESLVDGGVSSVTATTRERTLLLVLPQPAFRRLFDGDSLESHMFLDVVLRDLMAALRQALRPQAHLAASL